MIVIYALAAVGLVVATIDYAQPRRGWFNRFGLAITALILAIVTADMLGAF